MNPKKAKRSTKNKQRGYNARQLAGLAAKSGRRRPPSLESYRDRDGKRHWRAKSF